MREFKKRRNQKGEIVHLSLRGLGCLALFGVAILAVHAAWGMYGKLSEASGGRESTEVQLATLRAQETRVATAVANISSSRGVETQLRERFGVARPGEGMIQIVRDTASTSALATPSESWWSRIFHTLFVW